LLPFLPLTTGVCARAQRIPAHVLEQIDRESSWNRSDHNDYQTAAKFFYASRNPKHLNEMDKALSNMLPAARKMSLYVCGYHSWEKAHHYKAYHDDGAILLAKACTLLHFGNVSQAAPVIDI
jgi:hypothetical protein